MDTIRGLGKSKCWDYENGFYWFSSPTRINKMLSHYELYKSIQNLPGDILELGVYKGASLVRLATFRNSLENDFSRKIVGFDSFGDFPTENLSLGEDLDFVKSFEKTGGAGLQKTEILSILSSKGFSNIHLEQGNIFDTLPAYLRKNPQTRIAFLHLDLDVKEPTGFALNLLYERIVPGGLIVFDDYNAVAGETVAVDAFIEKHNLYLEKLPFYSVPSYLRKK
jgi:hypothetical protein